MFKKIAVATDISVASYEVIGCIKGLKFLGAEEVVLIHALGIRHLESLKYELSRLAEPDLIKQKILLEEEGFKVKIEIGPFDIDYEVNRIAMREKVSLVVIGTHGKSLMKHALLGGRATAILQTSRIPLLVVRVKVTDDGEKQACQVSCFDFKKPLLFATDFSDISQRAFTYVENIVKAGCKCVVLMHVQDKAVIGKHLNERLEEFNQIDQERLDMLKERLLENGAETVNTLLPYGSPISEILNVSRSDDFSLIIMGTQGRGFINEVFLGSVSHNVVRNASLPVLLIPAIR